MSGVWSFLHKLGSPRWFYRISSQWLPWLSVLAGGLLLWGVVWGLAFAPADGEIATGLQYSVTKHGELRA